VKSFLIYIEGKIVLDEQEYLIPVVATVGINEP
jgi:hypothetical protein